MRRLGLSLLVLLLAASPAVSQVPDDKLIVPGVRIGRWTLSMTIADYVRINGPATWAMFWAGTAYSADAVWNCTLLTWPNQLPLGPATHDEKTVAFLVILSYMAGSSTYKTDRGLGFAATRTQVLKVYGEPTAETSSGPGWKRLIYDRLGIAFVFSGNNLWVIDVFRPGTADRHWHLI